MPSPDNTVISLPGQTITDAAGNSWAINNGRVSVNGQVDPTTANVIQMAYEGGVVWQKNTQDLWWSKTAPDASWSPTYGTSTDPIPNQVASPNDTVLHAVASGAIFDGKNWWTIANGQVLINGKPDVTTARVVALVYSGDQVWQQNADGLWWGKSSPTSGWNPPYGTSQAPTPAAKPILGVTQVTLGSTAAPIMDASGNQWAIQNGQVTLNGVADQSTRNVTELAYVNGQVWQENADGLWWSKSVPADQWGPTYGTSQSPVPPTSPSPARTWVGQSGSSFDNPAAWSPTGVPQAGETALLNNGSVSIQPGDATGVNLALGGSANVHFLSGPSNVGQVSGGGTLFIGDAGDGASVAASGFSLGAGNTLQLLEWQDPTDQPGFSGATVHGDSYLGQGSQLSVFEWGRDHPPTGTLENDGRMAVDGATVYVGNLSGNGSVSLTNNATMEVVSTGNTIELQSGHLELGDGPTPISTAMSFKAPITDFGPDSTIALEYTPATSEVFRQLGATAGEIMLYNASTLVADLTVSGQSMLYASYTPNGSSLGAPTIISAHDNGHSLPITVT